MIIWMAMAIPLIAILILVIFFQKKIHPIEYIGLFLVPFIFIAIFKLSVETSMATDTEYWNNYVTKITYFQDWDEKVHCRHPKYCTKTYTGRCGSGKKTYSCTKTKRYQCGWYHPYDVDYHPEHWDAEDNSGSVHSIDKNSFEEHAKLWGNRVFQDLNRTYYSKDGDAYYTIYNKDTMSIISVTTAHSYENKVQTAKSVYSFKDISQEEAKKIGLYDYPDIGFARNYNYIFGDNNENAQKIMRFYNGMYGTSKKVHAMILVYRNKPEDIAYEQEAYWKGGNKNEFILCVGVDNSNNILWTKIISWTKEERLKIDVNADVYAMKTYDIEKISKYFGDIVTKNFKKRSFKEFNYLTVDPPQWEITLTYIITLLMTIGISIFVVKNGLDFKDKLSA